MLFFLTRRFSRQPPADEWRVTMLDVGQGLAMVIERHGKALLYDTGPAWPQGDSGQQVIIPWLRWHHLQLQGIMLSHEHLDHRGGLDSVLQAWPQAWVRSPLGWAHHLPCHRGERWQWQGLNFQALWPLPGSTAKGNNHSCVVRIDDGRSSILLTGDIERQAGQAMISRYWRHLTSTLIQVPHHGSNTSSSALLIRRVDGAAALASASRYNAWRMPSYKVVQRYRRVLGERTMWIGTREQAGEHLGVLGARARGVVGDVVVAMAENWVLVDPRVHSEAAMAMPGVHGSFTPAETEVPLLITEA